MCFTVTNYLSYTGSSSLITNAWHILRRGLKRYPPDKPKTLNILNKQSRTFGKDGGDA
jgi:hypothetical protein